MRHVSGINWEERADTVIRLFGHYIPRPVFALGLVEMCAVFICIEAATHLRYILADLDPPSLTGQLPEKLTFLAVFYIVALAVGLYQREACRNLRMTMLRLGVAMIIAFAAMSVIFFLFPDVIIWRSIFIFAFVLIFAGVLLARSLFSLAAGTEAFKRRVVVLGAGRRAARILELAESGQNQDFVVVATVSMSDKERQIADATPMEGIPDLRHFIEEQKADEIVTAMEERRGSLPVGPLLACKLAGVVIRDFSAFMERETGIVDLDGLNPSWIIYGDRGSWGSLDQIAKRAFDIVTSLLLLIFTLPILLMTAAAVKLTSKGPVFYRQERVGYGGRPFMLFKFRSMRTDAEADGAPKWAQKNDPRTTPVGRFIRMTRIDEIPQIINVLRGEMSFVGPRPERPFFVHSLSEELPYYGERHAVKPGITGWAQLNYPYGATTEDARRKLQYDLYYIKNYSLFLDILILLQTARVILFPVGFAR